MFEPEVFRKQMHCIEESTCDTVGLFGEPKRFGARGIAPPSPPRYALELFSQKCILYTLPADSSVFLTGPGLFFEAVGLWNVNQE